QVTLTKADAATANARIDLLEARAAVGECDLVVHAGDDGPSYLFEQGAFVSNRSNQAVEKDASLRAQVRARGGRALTFTCVPPGSGVRLALDRDGDGYRDGDEETA